MTIETAQRLSKQQKHIIRSIDTDTTSSQWRDWKWQMKHCIHDLDTFQTLLGTTLPEHLQDAFKTILSLSSLFRRL